MEEETAYSLLKVPSTATATEILQAYQHQASKYHPRLYAPTDRFIQIHFRKLAEAFETLIDPAKRRDYDGMLRARVALRIHHQRSGSGSSNARPRRNSYAGGGTGGTLGNPVTLTGKMTDAEALAVFRMVVPDERGSSRTPYGDSLVGTVVGPPVRSASRGATIARPSSVAPSLGAQYQQSPSRWPHPPPARSGSCAPRLPQPGASSVLSATVRGRCVIEPDGSYHVERTLQTRTLDGHGNIRDSVRRQTLGVNMDPGRSSTSGRASVPARQPTRASLPDDEYLPLSMARMSLGSSSNHHRSANTHDAPHISRRPGSTSGSHSRAPSVVSNGHPNSAYLPAPNRSASGSHIRRPESRH